MSRVSQARNLGKYFLLIDNMLVVLGFFVVFPLISIRFVDQMGWAAVMVGIALGLRQFIQQGLGIFGGAIADRFGAKPMIVTGMLMPAAFGAGGETNPSTTTWSFFLAVDDAGQCRCGHWRIVGELAVAIRLSPGLRHRGRFVCAVCGVQCVVVTGMETLHRTHARSRRHDPRDA